MRNVKKTNDFNRELEVIMIQNRWSINDLSQMTGYCKTYLSSVRAGSMPMTPKFMSRLVSLKITKEQKEQLMETARDLYLEGQGRNWERLTAKYIKETKRAKA